MDKVSSLWRLKLKKLLVFLLLIAINLFRVPSLAYARSGCFEPVANIYEWLSPAVVFISAVDISSTKRTERVSNVIGSGFIIGKDGIVLTNSHVVFGLRSINVTMDNGETVDAKVVGVDPILDLAALRVPVPPEGLTTIPLGDSERIRVGDQVMAIGNPFGLEQTLTLGVVSGINRILSIAPLSLSIPLIQTDTAINPGSSGGPLLNRCGEVIGITTAILGEAQNISFALPINLAKKYLPQLIKEGRIIRPWIGVSGKLINKDLEDIFNISVVDGFLVETVDTGSPADHAEIQEGTLPVSIGGMDFIIGGDIITAINGQLLQSEEIIESLMNTLKVGDKLNLTLFHDGVTRDVNLSLVERPVLPGDLESRDQNLFLLPMRHRTYRY
jgi:S1-C subfamily serine protease